MTPREATRLAVMSGLDMSMTPFSLEFHDHCVSLANEDSAFLNRVNDAVRRILYVKERVGLFENPYPSSADL